MKALTNAWSLHDIACVFSIWDSSVCWKWQKNRGWIKVAQDFHRLSIVEIRIPFVWNERQYFKKRSNEPSVVNNYGKKYVVFCIIYTDVDMQSTQKVMVDSSMADVVFTELIELYA